MFPIENKREPSLSFIKRRPHFNCKHTHTHIYISINCEWVFIIEILLYDHWISILAHTKKASNIHSKWIAIWGWDKKRKRSNRISSFKLLRNLRLYMDERKSVTRTIYRLLFTFNPHTIDSIHTIHTTPYSKCITILR